MKVYISGKVRGLESKTARAAFDKAAKQVQAMGSDVVNPLDIVEEMEEEVRRDEKRLMMSLLMELSHCDAIWMLDNWKQDSHGAACEYHFAKATGIMVMNVPESDELGRLLEQRYRPYGNTESMVMMTTAEIAYELEDMCEVSSRDVSKWLHEHGFETVVKKDIQTWVLYEVE